jgi:hypothetical protein
MRFIIMHKTNAHWESGAAPGPDLIARVGTLLGELARTGCLLGAEGLRASSQGARVWIKAGNRTIVRGPFEGGNELPAGFTIVQARSLDDAIEWATQDTASEDVDIDIRPVTEPWDIGIRPAPNAPTRRYMILRKATAATEAGVESSSSTPAASAQPSEQSITVRPVVTETMRPSSRGRRYKNSSSGVTAIDGPFAETKELIGGYVIVSADSLDEAGRLAERYIEVVEADEVDVRELT